jgi:toxin ParE1/3/4
MAIKWRELASDDLLSIVEYIAQENPVAAYEVDAEIYRQIDILDTQPSIGRDGRIRGTKELVFVGLPYIAPYRIIGKDVEILRVYHTAQEWGKSK